MRDFKINRRGFLWAGCLSGASWFACPKPLKGTKSKEKLRLRVIFALLSLKQDKPDWPNLGFDFAPVIEGIKNQLTNAFPEIEFLFSTATGITQANAIILKDILSPPDGYIVYQMNNWKLVIQTIVATGKPVLFVDYTYGGTGGFLVYSAMLLRHNTPNLAFVSSRNPDDLISAIKCFELVKKGGSVLDFSDAVSRLRKERTPLPGEFKYLPDPLPAVSLEEALEKIRSSRILAIGYPGVSLVTLPQISVKNISFTELNQSWEKADLEQAREVAGQWQKSAERIEEVSEETLLSSARMYLGMKTLLSRYQANAITINCLVGFYTGRISAYPCLGFFELNNEGLIGACECDVRSAGTMIAVNALTKGRPGYISDPVLDSSKRQIIYAHCVAPNRVFGPDGSCNPFEILTHSEDRKGASVRSILPAGYLTTTLEIAPEKRQILFHQAKTVGNDPDDRACRTKLVAEPLGDFEKLFTMWDLWGWHRVTVYGDLKERIFALADHLGYQVVSEA